MSGILFVWPAPTVQTRVDAQDSNVVKIMEISTEKHTRTSALFHYDRGFIFRTYVHFWWLCTWLHAVGFHLLTQKSPWSTLGKSTVFIPSSTLGCCFVVASCLVTVPSWNYTVFLELSYHHSSVDGQGRQQDYSPLHLENSTCCPIICKILRNNFGVIFAMTPFSHKQIPTSWQLQWNAEKIEMHLQK